MTGCPTDQELESLLDERVAPPDTPTRASSLLTHHLESCNRCQARVVELQRDREFMNEIVSVLSDVSDRTSTGTPAKPTAATLTIAGYDIDGELHRGAQGVVFKAHQRSTNRKVALKVLYHESGTSLRIRQRFLREIELAAQLRHPNVVTIFDSGETDDGRLYFAMEFVDGPRLDAFAKGVFTEATTRPAETRRRILQLFDAVCAGVAHAHHAGVIHRDLKPGNILIGADGAPKVLDFGLAKATDADVNSRFALNTIAGSFMGTIAYASPEQTRGKPDEIDTRSDIYALGVLLHELVTGTLPYDVTGPLKDGIDNVLNAQPATPLRWRTSGDAAAKMVDRDLETIILKALAKEPERRYPTVDALREDIAHYLSGTPIGARRDSAAYVAMRYARRHRLAIAFFAVALVLTAAFAELIKSLSTTQQAAETAADRIEQYASRLAQQEMWDATSGAARDAVAPPASLVDIDREAMVTVNGPEAPQALNPMFMHRGDLFVCELIFERLFWRDASLDLVPNEHLVASIDDDDDPAVKSIHLREGLTWHDGEPLTADDVVYSWRQTISPPVKSTKQPQASRIVGMQAADARTVTMRFDAPHATWRISANFELIPQHLFAQGDEEDPTLRKSEYFQDLHRHPVGSGPFRLVSWDSDEIKLERFAGYEVSGQRPYIGGLVVRWMSSPDARLNAFLHGGLDLFELTDDQYRDEVYQDAFESAGREARRPSSRYHYVLWNCADREDHLDDPAVRRALAMAINIDRIKAVVTNNLAAACFGPWRADSPYSDPSLRRFAYQPEAAGVMLRSAIASHSADAGKRHATSADDGVSMRIELLVDGSSDGNEQAAAIIRDSLSKIGVGVEITVLRDRSEMIRRVQAGGFDACLMATTPGIDPQLHHVEFVTGERLNLGAYSNAEVDRIFHEASGATDEVQRVRLFREIHRLIYTDQPRCFLYHEPALWAVSRRLSGVGFSDRGPYYFQPGVVDWYVANKSDG